MSQALLRRSFVAFHLVLGLGLLAGSAETLLHALSPENLHSHQHLAFLAGIEALGAILFLVPRTLRAGPLLLMATLGIAFVAHSIRGELRPDLAIYAAGALLVFAHGSLWPPRPSAPDASS